MSQHPGRFKKASGYSGKFYRFKEKYDTGVNAANGEIF